MTKASDTLLQLRKYIKAVEDGKIGANYYDFVVGDTIEQIQRRTRLGKGVTEGGALEKLSELSDSYKDKRKKSKLDGTTKPNKSNLTFTGQLLKSLRGKRQGVSFFFTLNNQRDDDVTNSEIANWQADKGRRFFDLSTSERKGLARKIAQVLKDLILRGFK